MRSPNLVDAQGNGELSTLPLVPSNWNVFDKAGHWLSSITLPPRFMPMDVGPDYVLGLAYGASKTRRLVMFDIGRSPRAH